MSIPHRFLVSFFIIFFTSAIHKASTQAWAVDGYPDDSPPPTNQIKNIYGRLKVKVITPYHLDKKSIDPKQNNKFIIFYPYHPLKKNQKTFLADGKDHFFKLFNAQDLATNSNLSADYVVEVRDVNYQTFRTNISFNVEKKSITLVIHLRPKPFTLTLQDIPQGTDIYINKKKLLTAQNKNISFTNIQEAQINLMLLKDDYHYYRKIIRQNNLASHIIKNPSFTDYRLQSLYASMLGIVPGLNLFMHVPSSGLGVLIPSAVVFYSVLSLRLLSFANDIKWLSPSANNINLTTLDLIILTSSLAHALFTYFYAINDHKEFFEKYLDPRSKYSFSFEKNLSKPNQWSAHFILKQYW